MAYCDMNSEGLTFSEWIQAAGYYKPDPAGGPTGGPEADCAPYSSSYQSSLPCFNRWGMRAVYPPSVRSTRSSSTHFPRKLRQAWRNGEDPSEYRQAAPKVRTWV